MRSLSSKKATRTERRKISDGLFLLLLMVFVVSRRSHMVSKHSYGNGVTEHTDLMALGGFSDSDWDSMSCFSTAKTETIEQMVSVNRIRKETVITSFLLCFED